MVTPMTDWWDTAKTYAGTLRGYRAWRPYRPICGRMESLIINSSVESSTLTASCKSSSALDIWGLHQAPRRYCTCGLYAFYRIESLRNHDLLTARHLLHSKYHEEWVNNYWNFRIVGVIDAFSRVILHDLGFRAEKAKIKALCHPNYEWRELFRFNYPDVEIFESMDEMVESYPPTHPEWHENLEPLE